MDGSPPFVIYRESYFVEAKPLDLVAPAVASQKIIIIFRCIAEAGQIFAKDQYHIGTHFLGFVHKLQLVKASSSSFIVAGDNDLLLLYSERQGPPTWILLFEDGGIEAISLKQSVAKEGGRVLSHEP